MSRTTVQRVHGFQLQFLRLKPDVLANRADAGRIVDGHGDLRPEHICLSDPLAIFDCIEFNPEFRAIDVADELAFLGLLSLAMKLVGAQATKEAQRHLALADQYAAPWLQPLVLVVGGLSGTGKTTLAVALADALGAELLRTDVVRQELLGTGARVSGADAGIYRPKAREQVYVELYRRASALQADRLSVVLDGTFSTLDSLARARKLAADQSHALLAIECICRPEIARERISRRLATGHDASEARPEIHDLQRTRWETWPAEVPQICNDTEEPLQQQVEHVIFALRRLAMAK